MLSTNILLVLSMLHTLVSAAHVELFAGTDTGPEESRLRETIMSDDTDYMETLRSLRRILMLDEKGQPTRYDRHCFFSPANCVHQWLRPTRNPLRERLSPPNAPKIVHMSSLKTARGLFRYRP